MNNKLGITSTPEIDAALAANAPVAIGVSGGKDSSAVACATVEYLDNIGHAGPRVLIHSDLGRVEWKDSAPTCERLAAHLGLELVTVRRTTGGMLERWQQRWQNNVARYTNLECVKLILPWSTPTMRFCTSELKTAVICRELVQRFPGQTILSVSGIRREESPKRAKAPVAKVQNKLTSVTHATSGFDWHPIIDWTLDDVLDYLDSEGVALHEAYTRYGSSRVSCAFCILGSSADLMASSACPDNQDVYREMVALEVASTFSFQDTKWLGDVAPHLLTDDMRCEFERAKPRATLREQAEARIPQHLLYTKGWPTCIPRLDEARLLCEVRWRVAEAVGIHARAVPQRTRPHWTIRAADGSECRQDACTSTDSKRFSVGGCIRTSMGENSNIEWTDHTFNPWHGCTKVSHGCTNCYAETLSRRWGRDIWGPKADRMMTSDANWKQPLKWQREAEAAGVRRRVFCASMADVFERHMVHDVDIEMESARLRLWALIKATPMLDWLLLTKRPENILTMIPEAWRTTAPANVWYGTSTENQEQADARIPELLKVPAAVRFLSAEPLLGPVDLRRIPVKPCHDYDVLRGTKQDVYGVYVPMENYPRIHWVIAGGESGHGARPCHPGWVRSLRDQCQAAGVAFFHKQWGEYALGIDFPDAQGKWTHVCPSGHTHDNAIDGTCEVLDGDSHGTCYGMVRLGKHNAGRLLDGRTWDEFPEVQQ